MNYWHKILEEITHKHDPHYSMVFTNARERVNPETPEVNQPIKNKFVIFSNAITKKHTQIRGAQKKYNLGKNFPGVYFTRREAQIAFYFIQGASTLESAKSLDLSRRTVEFYTNNMKIKLGCRYKSDLILKITQSDFLELIDFGLETEA